MEAKRRNAIVIMGKLTGLVKPLLHVMIAAVILGTAGYLCAIFLTITAVQMIVHSSLAQILIPAMLIMAVLRGILHYAEQYCNHYIAFKLLAIIRHKVFASLRRLCPAKLEGRDKGNLISLITTDIELLEVFYAHTISPIAIAVLTSVTMVVFIGSYHILAGAVAFLSYLIVGAVIPLWNGRRGRKRGIEFRTQFGELNSFVLDSLRGLDETLQYGQGKNRKAQMIRRSKELAHIQKDLSRWEGEQRSLTNIVILLSTLTMMFLTLWLYARGGAGADGVLICTVAMTGSFGPVAALSNLSNNLNQTLASGERVLSLLEEEPLVREIPEREEGSGNMVKTESAGTSENTVKAEGTDGPAFSGAALEHVTFAYGDETILDDYTLALQSGKITGIHGSSGSGKSTMLKLLMRFWDADGGSVLVNGDAVDQIPTKRLRNLESYVTQETHLFHDSIANNIALAKKGATREEITEAAKKASIHDFILSLPKGYDTEVGELGDTLSGGERQRIGMARAFLHEGKLLLLDEPTSNLDALNEGVILKSLKEFGKGKTVVLVSHRRSTLNIADSVFEMKEGRVS